MKKYIGILAICLIVTLLVPMAVFAQDESRAESKLFFTQDQVKKIKSFDNFKDVVNYLKTIPGTKEKPLETVSPEEAARLRHLSGRDGSRSTEIEAGYLMFGHDSGHTGYPRAKYIVYASEPYAADDLVCTWDQQDGWEIEYMVTHLWAHQNSNGTGDYNETAWELKSELDGDAQIEFWSYGNQPLVWSNQPVSHSYYFGIHAWASSTGVFNQIERIVVDLSGGLYSWGELNFQNNWYADNVDVAIEQLMENPADPDPNNTWLYYNYLEIRDVNDILWDDELDTYSYWHDNQWVAGIEPAHGDNFPWGNSAWLKMQVQ